MCIQAIEALDPLHKCVEYWENKLLTKKSSSSGNSLAAEKNSSETRSDAAGEIADSFETDILLGNGNYLPDDETRSIFRRLLRKASREEMEIMERVLCKGPGSPFWRVAVETLREEIERNKD